MMKYLILLMLIPGVSFANYVREVDLGKENGVTIYKNSEDCPGACLKIEVGSNISEMKVGSMEVEDKGKPLFAQKEAVKTCSGTVDCFDKIKQVCTGVGEERVCLSYCQAEGLPSQYFSVVNQNADEVYCTRINGYEKQTVKVAAVDMDKRAARKAEKDAKKAEKAAKLEERKERVKQLRKANTVIDGSSLEDEVKALLKHIVKELVKDEEGE